MDKCSLFMLYADDYRLFCGDLGNEVNDDVLSKAFSRFPTFNMARVSYLSDSSGPLKYILRTWCYRSSLFIVCV